MQLTMTFIRQQLTVSGQESQSHARHRMCSEKVYNSVTEGVWLLKLCVCVCLQSLSCCWLSHYASQLAWCSVLEFITTMIMCFAKIPYWVLRCDKEQKLEQILASHLVQCRIGYLRWVKRHCFLFILYVIALIVSFYSDGYDVISLCLARERSGSDRVQWGIRQCSGRHLGHHWQHADASTQSYPQWQAGTSAFVILSCCAIYFRFRRSSSP